MNLPNKLTVTRLILAPVVFVWFFAIDLIEGLSPVFYGAILAVLYIIMELTDLFDGKIARKRGLVTDLGKVLDPFGDVISHLTFFTLFLYADLMPVWAFVLILWREFSQSFIRMLLMGKGKPMAANIFGKAKTCFYAFCSVCAFILRIIGKAGISYSWTGWFMTVCWALAAFFSVGSFIIYIKNTIKSGVLSSMTR